MLLSPVLETCENCNTRANHELIFVDTDDNYVEYQCVNCGRPLIRSYERVPKAITRLLERMPSLGEKR